MHRIAGQFWGLIGALLLGAALLAPARLAAQDGDFLTADEIDAVRDAQEAEKRIPLYLEIAELRLGAIRAAIASVKPGAGRTAQRKMTEYTRVLEALETAIFDARERRMPFPKAMELLKTKLPEAKQFLESLDDESSPLYEDYQYTLEEAVDMTGELVAEVERGMFPEVDERTAPKEFPAAPPREERRKPSVPSPTDEGGPPRKAGAPAAPAPSEQDGPPRKSNRR
jgi:hypothetical protein